MAGTDNVPTTPTFSEEELDLLRAAVGTPSEEVPTEDVEPVVEQPIKRKRGRPRKYPVSQTGTKAKTIDAIPDFEEPQSIAIAAPLTKKDEKEVASRLQGILIGGTGLASQVKPYLQMTEEEAAAIAAPLSSYLVRNADTLPVAKQILENYDILAITLGVLAYVVRVYRDRSNELAEYAAEHPEQTFNDRVAQLASSSNNGQAEGNGNFISAPYG